MSDEKKINYKKTVNLPKTSFSMKANLVQREPQMRKQWANERLYERIRQSREGAPLYILHDGPPYTNGDIHMGHVINKVLKDFVVKYKTMAGFNAPYIPGWDCHGLPIESRVVGSLGEKAKTLPKEAVRRECMKYASKYVKLQGRQFQDLGVLGDFDDPYLTFKPSYEEGILEVFAELVGKGLVYKQLKPIHWCVGCETALAEAELEYRDVSSPSIFVNFPADGDAVKRLIELGLLDEGQAKARVCFMIWTTTPWTLAANLAIAVHPFLDYTTIRYEKKGHEYISVVANDRLGAVVQAGGLEEGQYEVSETKVRGSEFEGLRYLHPFTEENPTEQDAYKVIPAEYVTTEDGTGLVHTAPGHGLEDYMSGQKHGMAVYSPVQDDGTYDETVPAWLQGKNVMTVDKDVNAHLKEHGWLFAQTDMMHSYPHCWRSKDPVIFRATEQWFVGVDRTSPDTGRTLREMADESVNRVRWIPAWGQKRIAGMLESRPDWCISRQRSWGLPIPVFTTADGRTLLTKESVLAVARHIGKHGSDSWFTHTPRQILGDDFPLPEGFDFDSLEKEENIFDVWFESGCSWYTVCQRREHWPIPVDLYLEGSDQHRGWFQLSLLPALGAVGHEPFKSVLTHGFTVDEKGMKQSKSLGNYVNAQEEVAKYGADILRLWVSSVNYQEDMRCNDELIGRTQEAYRKIRNTLRFLFGNIDDFDPARYAVPYEQMFAIDKWAMQRLQKLIDDVTEAYDNFVFHRVFGLLYNFCTVEMSSIYMDVLKDRMYCDAPDSLSRRSGQTGMYHILGSLIRMLAPILVHTAEEAWGAMNVRPEDVESVHLAHLPRRDESIDYEREQPKWQKIMGLRDEVLRVLEGLRQDKAIASNQEASVTMHCTPEDAATIHDFGIGQFTALCIVSEIKLEEGADQTTVTAEKSTYPKCQRCWNYWPSVGTIPEHPEICERCAEVIETAYAG